MPTPDESRILKIIEAEGGVGRIVAKMRLNPGYVRIILRSIGEKDNSFT
jgi:hypothetical protein